ncbi:MAG: PD-(D/E)XK nuclease family protein [Solirubrobacterales bacterium]|nr:PD-(D/E)XK nuclease family protein [Solirubrobacterales bacterium]
MPLTVIKGPPNSGRTDLIQQRYLEALPRDPVLVVPSVSDIRVWEERLVRAVGAHLGGRIMHFSDLVSAILDGSPRDPGTGTGEGRPAGTTGTASEVRRQQVIRRSFSENWPEMSERVRRQPGLVGAMLEQVDEFRQALIDPETLDHELANFGSEYLSKVSAVYRGYAEDLERSGWTDQPAEALAAAKTSMSSWSGTPIYVAGFDDLTRQQLEVVTRLAAETDVTIAITHESENRVFDAIAPLLAELESIGGRIDRDMSLDDAVGPTGGEATDGEPGTGHHPTLMSLQREFMRQTVPGSLPSDGSVSIMRSTGRRGEAKAIAASVARLLDQGTDPDQIAVAIAGPGENGGVFRDVLTEYSIPASLECETRAADTVVGRSVLTLIEAASPSGSAEAFIRYLRGPTGFAPEQVDRLEFKVLNQGVETAAAAAAILHELEERLPTGWERLREEQATGQGPGRNEPGPGSVVQAIGEVASEMALDLLGRDPGIPPSEQTVTEVRMASEIGRACADLGESRPEPTRLPDIAELIDSGAVTIWSTPSSGTIRIASPYSLRAKRYEHLFVASLQERGLEAGDRSGPFLEKDVRQKIGLPDPRDPDLHELYLFASCLAVPTRSLFLSCRVADDQGKAEQPSPLIDAVESMFPEGSLRRFGRSASHITYAPSEAPSVVELGRSLAAAADAASHTGPDLAGLPDRIVESVQTRLARARSVEESTRSIARLTNDAVLSTLRESTTFSPTALEAFIRCPYEWFFEKAMAPESFGPDPEAFARGALVHAVLADLYEGRSGTLPEPADVDEWIAELEPAIARIAAQPNIGLGSDSASDRIARRELRNQIETFIRNEADREQKLFLPREFELKFGMGDEPPVDIGEWSLRGSIDRIDVREDTSGPVPQAIALDYKTGAASVLKRQDIDKQQKLQLQLYMYVMREHFDLDPVAGLYMPVTRAGGEARGIVGAGAANSLTDLDGQENDRVDCIGEQIDKAVQRADEAVAKILAGEIDHGHDECLRHLTGAAVPDPALIPPANDPGPGTGGIPAGGATERGAGNG